MSEEKRKSELLLETWTQLVYVHKVFIPGWFSMPA